MERKCICTRQEWAQDLEPHLHREDCAYVDWQAIADMIAEELSAYDQNPGSIF